MFENTIIGKHTPEEVQNIINESNSFKELAIQLGYSGNSGTTRQIIEKFCNYYNLSLEPILQQHPISIARTPENIFIENSTASQATLRRWYLKGKYSEYKCAICGQEPFWNNKELTLTLDHINGDNRDDRLENLRWVCPNCDRQLDTFCSKNMNYDIRKYKKQQYFCKKCGKEISKGATLCTECYALSQRKVINRPSAEELVTLLKEHNGGFTAVGRIYDVNDNTIRKWCKAYGLPFHSTDYQN